MKQTAVEYLLSYLPQIDYGNDPYYDEIIKQAKELEREQIEDAFCDGVDDEYEHHINDTIRKNSEQYYNKTFNNYKK